MARGRQVVCGPPQSGPVATNMSHNHRRDILDRYGMVRATLEPPRRRQEKKAKKRYVFYALSANKLEVIIFASLSDNCIFCGRETILAS